jgi:hypothetical protein
MPAMLKRLFLLLFVVGLTPQGLAGDTGTSEVALKTVNYGELCEAVKAQRGKIVVIDIWAEY